MKVEFPSGSGRYLHLGQVAQELAARLSSIFLPDAAGRRPVNGDDRRFAESANWRDLVLFYEYFHGENGRGIGASHQTGWTALVTRCIEKVATGTEVSRPSQAMQAVTDAVPEGAG